MTSTGSVLYTKEYPTLEDLESYSLQDLRTFAMTVEDDVSLLEEETQNLTAYLRAQKERDVGKLDEDDDMDGGAAGAGGTAGGSSGTGGGKRRGRAYRRRSMDQKDVFLLLEDKLTVLSAEQEIVRAEREKSLRIAEDAKDLLAATVEEAQNRVKEIKLEMAYFKREVVADKQVSADKVMKYFSDRPHNKEQYIAKLSEKCAALQHQAAKQAHQQRQRGGEGGGGGGGESFHAIDFDQLKIENHQFNERIEQKNVELVELKGTTTRTVQALNSLTDRLNALTVEQAQLRKELKSRKEYVEKLHLDIDAVKAEATGAQRKNTALKLQHESVKVPKVEDYIAQKAEMYELNKAAMNWRRKVEIAAGHVAVMKQQMLSISKKQQSLVHASTAR